MLLYNLLRGLIVSTIILWGEQNNAQQPQQPQPKPKKLLTIEEIYNSKILQEKSFSKVNPLSDGVSFSTLQYNESVAEIISYSFKDGRKGKIILSSAKLLPEGGSSPITIDDYKFNHDESKLLIATETEMIYRHSTVEKYYLYDLSSKKLKILCNDKVRLADFSPAENKIAYVKENNLYYYDADAGKEIQITHDGKKNEVINGATDWVYEEEFGFDQAYQWSPDGKKIAFYRFDESNVKEFSMVKYGDLYPEEVHFKYPKAGEENAKVSLHIYDLATSTVTEVKPGIPYEYIPRIKWTVNPSVLSVQLMNRQQNKLDLVLYSTATGKANKILTETSDTYIDVTDDLIFLPEETDGKEPAHENMGFIWTCSRDGYNHIYYYDIEGIMLKQVTSGPWDVSSIKGYDATNKTIFYIASEANPRQRDIYSIKYTGNDKFKITTVDGYHDAVFSAGYDYFVDYYSNANTPPQVTVCNALGEQLGVLEDNKALRDTLKTYKISPKKFFIFKTSEKLELNAWLINPADFDRTKKYPVFMYVYGGPGSQTVLDRWDGKTYLWHQLLAQKGYIIISVDNRGTGARGRDFKNCTYKQLGKLETIDLVEAAKYLSTLPTVDKTRIGIMGWSYGGYMSTLCILNGAEYFKAAIAVAPVTHWKFYDTIYTERYMDTPEANKKGYDEGSPLLYADSLKGKYLLIHGTADDNVHFQNTVEMINALTKANKQFDLFIYPDKNHGIYGGNTRLHLYTRMTEFILNNL